MSEAARPSTDSSTNKPKFIVPDREKLEAMAEFAAGAGHEINNPLATIIGRAQLLLKDETDPQRRQMLMAIGAQAYRIRDMIGDTMLFARPPAPELKDVNLANLVAQVVQKLHDELHQTGCSVKAEIEPSITVRADIAQISIVFSELLLNGQQALGSGGGVIQISAHVQSDRAIIKIVDQGQGFTNEEQEHAFDPFYSGRQAGRGLGFGLPKCWRIVDQHQGKIEIQSAPADTTTVTIEWPIA